MKKRIPLWRDKQDNYNLLENMFGSIEGGCSLGQICCEDFKNTKKRFYGAVTVQDSFILALSRDHIRGVVDQQ